MLFVHTFCFLFSGKLKLGSNVLLLMNRRQMSWGGEQGRINSRTSTRALSSARKVSSKAREEDWFCVGNISGEWRREFAELEGGKKSRRSTCLGL